jgi:hypothetical protein
MLLLSRHCEEPTGRANARPMTGSATKQSSSASHSGLLHFARNDGLNVDGPLFVQFDAPTGIGASASRVIEQGLQTLFHSFFNTVKPPPCPIINSC